MFPATAPTRLPGVLCEVRAPRDGTRPLRLDVAGFVGLAERGPLDVPVLIEDYNQYRQLFGNDLPLARDGGRPLYAHLARTVELFFENGGLRCYVVRVAGPGRANRFAIPGLLQEVGDGGWEAVTAPAAWIGRWSDLLSIATTLRLLPLRLRSESGTLTASGEEIGSGGLLLPVRAPSPTAIRPGDLLRLQVDGPAGENYALYAPAATVALEPTLGGPPLAGNPLLLGLDPAGLRLFRTDPAGFLPEEVAWLDGNQWTLLPFTATDLEWQEPAEAGVPYHLSLPVTPPVPIEEGALLRLSAGGDTPFLFFRADLVRRGHDPAATEPVRLIVETAAPLQAQAALPNQPHTITAVERLSFDLYVREGEETLELWPDLRFAPGSGYWQEVLQPPIDYTQVEPAAFHPDAFAGRSLRLGPAELAGQPLLLPLGIRAAPDYAGPLPDPLPGSKDGLDTFDPPALFLDPAFDGIGTRALLETANEVLYLSAQSRRLYGLHSLIPVDEVSLLALPDLVQRGWQMLDPAPLEEVEPPEKETEPPRGFHDCPIPPPPPPEEEEKMPVILLDPESVEPAPSSQAWLEDLPEQIEPLAYDETPLLEVQRSLIRLCAARADLVAILALPHHYQRQAIGQWRDTLGATPDFFDGDPQSYAAVYHSWTAIREPVTPALSPLRYLPPDGAICGMIATREQRRGAWVSPANVPLRAIVHLNPHFDDDNWRPLYTGQINLIRRHPGQYTLMSALTLARERTLQQLSVRRLLIFLRKLALREGQRYVFETNNERFRSLVQTYFEQTLSQILDLGGLQAYQVVTDERVNTPNDYDNGRFLIALKVAPTLPIEFITITLLRTGADQIDILER